MRRHLSAAILSIALGASSLPADASTPELESAVFRSIVFGAELYTVEARRKLASSIAAYWTHLLGRIPRLTPRELDWARGEMKTSDSNRLIAFTNSREGSLYLALEIANRCNDAAQVIPSRIGERPPAEALAWLSLLRCYSSADDLKTYFHNAALISAPRGDQEIKMTLISLTTSQLIGVVESVVITEK